MTTLLFIIFSWPFVGVLAGIFDAWRNRFRITYNDLFLMMILGYGLIIVVFVTFLLELKFLSKNVIDFRSRK